MKQNVVIQKTWVNSVKDYPDNVRLAFYEYIFDYVFSEEPQETQDNPKNPMGYLGFTMIKPFLDANIEKYNAVVERNRANGSKGGRPRKTQETKENPVGFLETQQNPKKPKKADNDNDNDNDINNIIDSSLHSESYSIDKSTELLSASQIKEFVTYWNSKLPTLKISQFTENRKSKLKVRLTEVKDEDPMQVLTRLVDCIANSKFLQGDNDRNFKGTIDWVIKNESNFTKVLEDRYNDTTTTNKPSPTASDRDETNARLRANITARLLGTMGDSAV
jgi:hypothetical protein